jgi:hypothetical protein
MARDFDGPSLPLRASGTFAGLRWELRGKVVGDSVYEWNSVYSLNAGGGVEGGGIGALPFADIGVKVLGALGSWGLSSGGFRSGWRFKRTPLTLRGVVASTAARVRVYFDNVEPQDALLLDASHPDVRFFFLIASPRARCNSVVALDEAGNELDRMVLPVGSRNAR